MIGILCYTICRPMKILINAFLLNLFLSIGIFFVSFYLAWQVNATAQFLYPLWYEVIDIEESVTKYAPYNKHKNGFEYTTKQERIRLFSGIVTGIQNKGDGLAQLQYTYKNKNVMETLLTKAEVIHLTDVAYLVNKFKYLALSGILIVVIASLLFMICKMQISSLNNHLIVMAGFVISIIILIILLGPTNVFYAGHDLVFPNQHQWFFYYEDSIMSTMMKAPILFAPIAMQLLTLTIGIWLIFLFFLKKTFFSYNWLKI